VKDQLEALIFQMVRSNILYSEAVREFKKRFIVTVLEENRGNQCKAARELGMHRNTLRKRLQAAGLRSSHPKLNENPPTAIPLQ